MPTDLATIGAARTAQTSDPDLEALQKRSSALFVGIIVAGFGGLPLSFATVGVLARLDRFLSLSAWMHALIIGVWLALTLAALRQRDRSRIAVLIVLAGLGVSVLFALIFAIDRI